MGKEKIEEPSLTESLKPSPKISIPKFIYSLSALFFNPSKENTDKLEAAFLSIGTLPPH